MKIRLAKKIPAEYLHTQVLEEIQINMEKVKNGFVASGAPENLYIQISNHLATSLYFLEYDFYFMRAKVS